MEERFIQLFREVAIKCGNSNGIICQVFQSEFGGHNRFFRQKLPMRRLDTRLLALPKKKNNAIRGSVMDIPSITE